MKSMSSFISVIIVLFLIATSVGISLGPTRNNSSSVARTEPQRAKSTRESSAPGAWSIETVDPGPGVGYDVSMAMADDGTIHIAYQDDLNDVIMYAKWNGVEWERREFDDILVKNYGSSIALDSAGRPAITFCDDGDLLLIRNEPGQWVSSVLDGADGSYVGCFSSIAFDSQNNMHISYQDATQDAFNLKYAYKGGGSWALENVDTDGVTGKYTSLAVGTNNVPQIAYQKTEGGLLKYAKKSGGWNIQTVDQDDEYVTGRYTSIKLDSGGNPHIAYYEATNGLLMYARNTGGNWVIENPDPDDNLGAYPSLVLDDDDRPHITYYGAEWDNGNGKLKYTYHDGTSWVLSTLDNTAGMGRDSTIVLDGDGRPVVAYSDAAQSLVKLLRWDEEAPVAEAGSNIFLNQQGRAYFDGSASTDNFCVKGYKWTVVEKGVQRTMSGESPEHKFAWAGIYEVKLNVTDAAGNWATDVLTVTVNDTEAPVANAGADQHTGQHDIVTFNGSMSTDNVGIVSYRWKVMDGSGTHTINDEVASYTFEDTGIFEVILNVTDASDNWATDNLSVFVRDGTPPVAAAGPDQTVDQGDIVILDALASTDNVGIVDYEWTFTDEGTLHTITGWEMRYKFENAGAYEVTLNVTDALWNWEVDTVIITVIDTTDPVADPGEPMTAPQGQEVMFNGSKSTDNLDIVKYEWTFFYDENKFTLKGVTVGHVFEIIGTYDVTLRVVDEEGNADEALVSVNVTDGMDPVAMAAFNSTGLAGDTVTFNGSLSSDNVGISQYTWSFMYRGKTKILNGRMPTFTFEVRGDYNVTLNVTDGEENWNAYTFPVKIEKKKDTGGDDDTTGDDDHGIGTQPVDDGFYGKLGKYCWALTTIMVLTVLVGIFIIVFAIVTRKKGKGKGKGEDEDEEKKKVEEKPLSQEEYYRELYGTGSLGAVETVNVQPQAGSPPPGQGP